jgi:hypothetical protein
MNFSKNLAGIGAMLQNLSADSTVEGVIRKRNFTLHPDEIRGSVLTAV